jgi:hypothetical protein
VFRFEGCSYSMYNHDLKRKLRNVGPSPYQAAEAYKGCETSRLPHCLDNGLTDGGKFVSPTYRPRSAPYKHYFSASGTYFC